MDETKLIVYLNSDEVPIAIWREELQSYKNIQISSSWLSEVDAILVPFAATERFGVKPVYEEFQVIDTWEFDSYYGKSPRFWIVSPVWSYKPTMLEAFVTIASFIAQSLKFLNNKNFLKNYSVLIDAAVIWLWYDGTVDQREAIKKFLEVLMQKMNE